jgi:phage protein D
MPDTGAFLDVEIICERWFAPNAATISLDCGRFWIDSVDFELPQHTVSVKASSIPTDQRIKGGDETRGWEDSSLKDISDQIASENGMTLDWQANYNPRYKRIEQTEESGLCFLKKRATDSKLAIKVCRNKLIFFDEEDYEAQSPSFTLVYGNIAATAGMACYRMSGGHFSLKVTDKKKSASVKYVNPETGRLTKEKFSTEDEDAPKYGTELVENPDADPDEDGDGELLLVPSPYGFVDWDANNPDQNAGKGAGLTAKGQRRAKSALREANKDKESANVEMAIGNPLIAAGQTFMLQGVGQFDGKWFIESATHTVGPMYDTKLNIRRCLEGY